MAEVSNNMLAGLLVLAIVISMFSIATMTMYVSEPDGPFFTGAATGAGKVNLTLSSSVAITLLRNESLFGSGYPSTTGNGILYVMSNITDNCGTGRSGSECFNNGSEGNGTLYGVAPSVHPFVARVDGNDASTCLRVLAASAAVGFIGGAAQTPVFEMAAMNNESTWLGDLSDACYGTLVNSWTTVTTGYTTLCDTVNHTDSNDEVRIHWRLGIPEDAEGTKSNAITVCAAGDCGSC